MAISPTAAPLTSAPSATEAPQTGARPAIDAPLTFGQLSSWRSIETFADDRLSEVNVPATWDVRGLDLATVRNAWAELVARHDALRTTFHLCAGQPRQRVHAVNARHLEERAGTGFDAAASTTAELYRHCFPVTGDPGWRAVLGLLEGRPQFLALCLSHLVVDVWAVTELESQFRSLAAGAALEPAPSPRALAALQRGEAWASRRRGAEKYWRRLLNDGPIRNLPNRCADGPETRIQATLHSPALAMLTAQAAGQHSVSAQSVLLAMTAAALGQRIDRDRVMLSVMSANRFDPAWQPLISSLNQLVPLAISLDPDCPLDRFLKRVHLNALMAYRHGAYDVDEATAWVAGTSSPSGLGFAHDSWFNYVTETVTGTGTPPAGPLREVTDLPAATCLWTAPRRQAGHPFYARVNSDGATWADVSLRVDPTLFPAEAVLGTLATIALGVVRAVKEPASTIGDLAWSGSSEVGSELFPRELAAA